MAIISSNIGNDDFSLPKTELRLVDSKIIPEEKRDNNLDEDSVIYLTKENTSKTAEGKVLDELNLTRMCCRRHMLTHVDIE